METSIRLKKKDIMRVAIQDENGNKTGDYLEFDLEDFEAPLRYQECIEQHKSNVRYVQNQFVIINKKQDHKGKKLLSSNQEEKIKVLNEFAQREIKTLDLVLGEGGTKKLLNGRKPYYSMFDDVQEVLEPIIPYIKTSTEEIAEKIKEKYKIKENDVLE